MATLKVGSLGDYIREQRESAQVSLRQLARAAGVSNPYLSQIERGLKKPSAEILSQIAKGLRISAETLYVQAGILDEREAGQVVDAVLGDPTIGERHKRVLIDVYESFRAEHAAEILHLPAPARKTTATKKSTSKRTATTKKKKAATKTATKTTAKTAPRTAKKRSTS
jgi:transcriptional regulator with XRE-family HTH domain